MITFDDGYDDGFLYALPILQHHSFVATYFIVTGRIGRPGDLTADQVRALASAGMEIGDHAADQLGLARLSMAKMCFQVETSALAIEALTGSRPTTFAYPFGSDDPSSRPKWPGPVSPWPSPASRESESQPGTDPPCLGCEWDRRCRQPRW